MLTLPTQFLSLGFPNKKICLNNIQQPYFQSRIKLNEPLKKDTFEKPASLHIYNNDLSFCGNTTTARGKVFRKLVGVHDPYSGVIMLTNNQLLDISEKLNNETTTKGKLNILSNYESSMFPVEKEIYQLFSNVNQKKPNLTMKRILENKSHQAIQELEIEQKNILDNIISESTKLDDDKQIKLKSIVNKAKHNIDYSSDDTDTFRRKPFISKIVALSEADNIKILRKKIMSLKNDKERSKAFSELGRAEFYLKTNQEKQIDSNRPIDVIRNLQRKYAPETLAKPNEMEKIIELAESLPTSKNNVNAFIIKYKDRSEKEISERILNQSIITIEHITPHSLGGEDEVPNFMMASKALNEERGNMSGNKFKKLHPDIPKYHQQYIDDIIRLEHKGKLPDHEWYPYVFKDTIKREYNFDIDISKYKITKHDAFRTFPDRLKIKYPEYASI